MEGSAKEKKTTMVFNKITGVREHLVKAMSQAQSIHSKLYGVPREAKPADEKKATPISFFDELQRELDGLNSLAIDIKMELEDISKNL